MKARVMSQSSQDAGRPAAARTPRLQRGHARVASLLAAAERVFVARGYDAATMTEIAADAGASIGSLYQFFPTKMSLAEALHVAELQALGGALGDCGAGIGPGIPLAGVAGSLFDEAVAFMTAHPVFAVLAERKDIDAGRKADTRRGMLDQLARLLTSGSPPPPPARARELAVLLLTMMKAAVSLRVSEASPSTGDRLIAELRAMLTAHLAASAGDGGPETVASPAARP